MSGDGNADSIIGSDVNAVSIDYGRDARFRYDLRSSTGDPTVELLSSEARLILDGDADDLAGAGVAGLADQNFDSVEEFLIGAPTTRDPAAAPAGRVYVIFGHRWSLPFEPRN